MAEFSQKLKVRLKNGTIQNIRIYSAAADIPYWQKPIKVRLAGNMIGWIPTSPLGSPDASSLRVRHPGSSQVYVVNTIGRAVYGNQMFGNPGNIAFTVPAGVRKIRVTCVGAGSSGSGYSPGTLVTVMRGNPGEGSWFHRLSVGGGRQPGKDGPKWPTAEDGYFWEYGVNAGNSQSGSFTHTGGKGFGASSPGLMHRESGFRGGIASTLIDVLPGNVFYGYVGKGGDGRYSNASQYSGNAAPGCILIEWGGNIE